MENLLNSVDPVVHGQVVRRRCGEVTFFAARLYICLRRFQLEKKKERRGIVENFSTKSFFFSFLQFLKTHTILSILLIKNTDLFELLIKIRIILSFFFITFMFCYI